MRTGLRYAAGQLITEKLQMDGCCFMYVWRVMCSKNERGFSSLLINLTTCI